MKILTNKYLTMLFEDVVNNNRTTYSAVELILDHVLTNYDLKSSKSSSKDLIKQSKICTCESIETTDVAKWNRVYHHVLCKKPIS